METTLYIGINGKENGNYYNIMYPRLRVQGLRTTKEIILGEPEANLGPQVGAHTSNRA